MCLCEAAKIKTPNEGIRICCRHHFTYGWDLSCDTSHAYVLPETTRKLRDAHLPKNFFVPPSFFLLDAAAALLLYSTRTVPHNCREYWILVQPIGLAGVRSHADLCDRVLMLMSSRTFVRSKDHALLVA